MTLGLAEGALKAWPEKGSEGKKKKKKRRGGGEEARSRREAEKREEAGGGEEGRLSQDPPWCREPRAKH